MLDPNLTLRDAKARLRAEVLTRRDALTDRDARSARIHARVLALAAWAEARMVSTFVGVGSEVTTLPLVEAALAAGKQVAVPVVEGTTLAIYRIDGIDDLAPAPFGLLEPKPELRRKSRRLMPTVVHLWLVPGLAFDRAGGRLGYGKGYYDSLLARVKERVPKVGLGFEVQMVGEVPMGEVDVRLPMIVTDAEEYLCGLPAASRPHR